MTKDDLRLKLQELEQEYHLKQKEVMREYCNANNPYKIGDKFTDHIGTILIEKISYSYSIQFSGTPSCVYFGTELNKNGQPNKRNKKRNAWQSNDEKQANL